MWAKEDANIDWIITQIVNGQFKDDRKTVAVMPQGLNKMPTLHMWSQIEIGDFWLLDGQDNVEVSKKIQLMTE